MCSGDLLLNWEWPDASQTSKQKRMFETSCSVYLPCGDGIPKGWIKTTQTQGSSNFGTQSVSSTITVQQRKLVNPNHTRHDCPLGTFTRPSKHKGEWNTSLHCQKHIWMEYSVCLIIEKQTKPWNQSMLSFIGNQIYGCPSLIPDVCKRRLVVYVFQYVRSAQKDFQHLVVDRIRMPKKLSIKHL